MLEAICSLLVALGCAISLLALTYKIINWASEISGSLNRIENTLKKHNEQA